MTAQIERVHNLVVVCAAVILLMVSAYSAQARGTNQEPQKLRVLSDEYPRVFFFRQAEGSAAQKTLSYEQWEKTFERLMGIEGKVLDEEIPGRSIRNIDFFTRFKGRRPDQLVLLHFNGNARDPRWQSDRFFAGHWIYFNGAKILSDVPAEQGMTDIRVENPNLFKVNMGRYRNSNEDIGLCMLDADSKPNWHQSEQVQLISVDKKNKTIRVRRGCYGTKPRAFPAGSSYTAAHMTEGPWGRQSHLLWYYNYSTCCPRDNNGRVCSNVLAEHLEELFGPDGALAAFDGLEFDVLKHRCGGPLKGRGADCDADGKIDGGFYNGINAYGAGVVEFCRQLRKRTGEDLLILADGMSERNQRAFGILNGIESEGWPHLRDHQINDWSGGLNRHFFWDKNARPPVFNYINHKFNMPTGRPGQTKLPDVPFSTHRLVFAVGAFTNSAICYSFPPKNDPDGLFGVWDEFRMGTENRLGWLGKPLGPAVRMATRRPDLLEGKGCPIDQNLGKLLQGDGIQFQRVKSGMLVTTKTKVSEMTFRLTDVPTNGPDLFVLLTARAEPIQGYPPEVARLMYVGLSSQGRPASRNERFMTCVNGTDFNSGFYFSNIRTKKIDLEFTLEGSESVWISRIAAYAHPDVIYREFENGLVLANPAPHPYTFELDKLFPGQRFRRLQASSTQDTISNDGSIVSDRLTLEPKEGLFLTKIAIQ